MKATIDENGLLTVRAETPLEAYALKRWHAENGEGVATENILFVMNPEPEENQYVPRGLV